jgi:pimeloyl-ACP methyl ester carboxylesterase
MNTHRDVPKLAAVAPPVAVAGGASMQRLASYGPKTYVLVHGAWHGGWCWSRVADHLRTEGHRVFTPTQTGVGERSHLLSKDIENVIECEELSDVILVGQG